MVPSIDRFSMLVVFAKETERERVHNVAASTDVRTDDRDWLSNVPVADIHDTNTQTHIQTYIGLQLIVFYITIVWSSLL